MPGLDKMGRPVGYGDGRSPSLADKVRLLQQLVRERQALPAGKKGSKVPVAHIEPRPMPRGGRPVNAPMRPSSFGGAPVDPGFLMPGARGFGGHAPDRNGNGGRPLGVRGPGALRRGMRP